MPALQNFVDRSLPVVSAAWLNQVDIQLQAAAYLPRFANLREALEVVDNAGGGVVILPPGRTTLEDGLVEIPENCGIVGSCPSSELYGPASVFSNTTLTNQYGATAAMLSLSGETSGSYVPKKKPFLKNFKLTSEVQDGRLVNGIVARNVEHIYIEGIEFTGFPVGCDIRAARLIGGNIIRTRHLGRSTSYDYGQQVQLTGIELDNDRVNYLASDGTVIAYTYVDGYTLTGQSNANWNDQTDGVHIAHHLARRIKIAFLTAYRVGEGIDIFGSYCEVIAPTLAQIYTYGIKFVHGASFNTVKGGTIQDVARAGVVFGGTNQDVIVDASTTIPAGDTTANNVEGLNITGIDWRNNLSGGEGCISLVNNGGATGLPRDNMVIGGRYSLGTYGKYGWNDQSTGGGNVGHAFDVRMNGVSGARAVKIDNGGSTVTPAVTSAVSVYRDSVQAIPTNAATTIVFNATLVDRKDEHSVSTGAFTCTYPGMYDFKAMTRCPNMPSGTYVKLYLRKGGSEIATRDFQAVGPDDESFEVSKNIYLETGEVVDIQIYHEAGADRNLTGGQQYTYMTIVGPL